MEDKQFVSNVDKQTLKSSKTKCPNLQSMTTILTRTECLHLNNEIMYMYLQYIYKDHRMQIDVTKKYKSVVSGTMIILILFSTGSIRAQSN